MHPLYFLNHLEHDQVVAAIRDAEAKSTGHIHVVVARRKVSDAVHAARQHLATSASHRHGVLIFVAPRSKNFAVIGDQVAHERIGDTAWRQIADAIENQFRRGHFMAGLVAGIERAGELLATHFPKQ